MRWPAISSGPGHARRDFGDLDDFAVVQGVDYSALLLIAAALAAINAAVLRAKSRRRYRGRHVRRGCGRHGRPRRGDLMDRTLIALTRVDVWILIVTAVGSAAAVAAGVMTYLLLAKPG